VVALFPCFLVRERWLGAKQDGKFSSSVDHSRVPTTIVHPELSAGSECQATMGAARRPHAVDYSLYLVTDSTLLSQSATSFEDHIEQLILGGVTVVQLREKSLSTADFIQRGRRLLEITRRHGIPLIINDRVDVVLAIDADGVHVGQDDMGFPMSSPCF
jgi:Thiamine monophosphate synthase